MRTFWKRFGPVMGSLILAVLIILAVVAYQWQLLAHDLPGVLRILCDGFFVAGIILGGIGLLIWIAGLGGFDGLAFVFVSIGSLLTPRKKRFEERKNYLEFKQEQISKERMSTKGILLVALSCIVISLVLVFLRSAV